MIPFGSTKSKPLTSYNFTVYIDIFKMGFTKISSIENAIETEVLVEGGENNFVHTLKKPFTNERVLTMERGISYTNQSISVGNRYKFMLIIVEDMNSKPKKIYVVKDALLRKKVSGELDAQNGGVYIETLEFVYKSIEENSQLMLLLKFI